MSLEEAIDYCIGQITTSVLTDPKEYNKFKMYKHRARNGELKDKAIQTLFDRFGIESHCYYRVKK